VSYAISLSGTTVSIASPGPRGVGVPTGGTTGQVLKKSSDTDYDFTWGTDTGGLGNVIEDTTPQLGGNLDVNGNAIVSASAGNIAITPDTTGRIVLDGFTWPDTDGTPNQVLKTNGSGTLSFGDASTVAALNDLSDVSVGSEAPSDVLVYRSGSGWINDALDYTEITSNVGSGAVDLPTRTDISAGSISDVVSLSSDDYADLANNGTPDPNTLYVITDGTTSIADSDDVTITGTPSDHSFLVYDSGTSDWINRAAADARADMGANDASNLTTGTLSAARLPAITDSYVGHIETPADGTYYLDPKVAEAREITGVYFAWTTAGSPDGDIDVQIGGTSVLSSTGRMNSGSSFTGTLKTDGTEDVAVDAVITVVLGAVNGVADVTDLRFSVEYAQ
jgi:hypothetical protein